jgi:hypothetical protein
MNTPSPASAAKKSHKKQKLLRSDEILVKRRQRLSPNGRVVTESPVATAVVVVDTPSPPPPTTVTANVTITPRIVQGQKRSTDFLTDRTNGIRRKKGIVMDDTRILGFLREPFTSVLKSSGKTMIDAPGLKRVAMNNFDLSYNPIGVKRTTRRVGRVSPVPPTVTQSQTDSNELPSDARHYDLPHIIPSLGTVESTCLRRYLLEDIMMAPVGEELILLVSTKHHWYASYKSIADKSTPLPLAYIRNEPFIQVKASVLVNCQLADLEHGNMVQKDIEGLLFGNGNGAIIFLFDESGESLQVLWKEFFDNINTIHAWGRRPLKRRFYCAIHNLTSLEARKALFQRLANEVDGDRTLAFDLSAAMAKKVTETANALKRAKSDDPKPSTTPVGFG